MSVSLPSKGLLGTKKKFKPHGKYRPFAIKYTGGTKASKPVKCTISSEEIPFHLLRSDGKDAVFLDKQGNVLPYWIETKNATLMRVWLKFPKASKSFLPVYMYYNNLQDVKLSDISAAFRYRRKITITEQSGSDLTDYPIPISLDEINFDFTRFQNKGQDLRFTDSSGNILPYYADISPWKAKIYVKVPYIPANGQTEIYMYYGNPEISSASSGQDTFLFYEDFMGSFKPCTFNTPKFYEIYKITIDSQAHNDYGLVYPITYVFEVEAGATKAQKSKDGSTWEDISRPTSDWYNFEEVVRFEGNRAYLSVKFYDDVDELYLRFVDDEGNVKQAKLLEIAKYYDNRRWVAIFTADDAYMSWVGNDTDIFCDELQSREMWGTIGVVTTNTNWNKIQTQINEGFIEVASHSRTHPKTPYSDYEAEIDQSKQEILSNLNLPSHQKRGSTEYVWSWIAPYGAIDDEVRAQCGQSEYLCMRHAYPSPFFYQVHTASFYTPWKESDNIYEEIIATEQGALHPADLPMLENIIDFAYEKGLVVIFYGHRNFEAFGDLLDYAKNKGDLWSVSLGHFFNYWFVAERGKITVAGYDGSWHSVSYAPAQVQGMPSCRPVNMECKDDPGRSLVRITDDSKLFMGGPYTSQYRSRAVGEIDLTDKISLITKFRVVQKEDHDSDEGVVAVSIDDNTLETSLDGDCPATFYIDEVNNKFSYLSNSSVNELANLDRQTDHILEIAANQTKYIHIKLDDEIVEDKPLNFAPTDGWHYLHLWSKTGRWVGVLFDYVIARPITDPEPLISLGLEESEAAVKYFVVNGTEFLYRRKITITEESGSDLNEHQVCINLNSSNFDFFHAQPDGRDIRFFDNENNPLSYWIEEWDVANERARIWVKVPSIPANGTTEIYCYYGNSEITDASDGEAVFEFFDDFEGDALDTNKWTIETGDWTIETYDEGKRLKGHDHYYGLRTKSFQATEGIIEVDALCHSGDDSSHGETDVIWWYKGDGYDEFSIAMVGSPNVQHSNLYDRSGGSWFLRDEKSDYKSFQEWYKIKVIFSGNTAKVYVNGSLWLESNSMNGERANNYVGLGAYGSTDYYDNFRVRKYASVEPSVSIGKEETP